MPNHGVLTTKQVILHQCSKKIDVEMVIHKTKVKVTVKSVPYPLKTQQLRTSHTEH